MRLFICIVIFPVTEVSRHVGFEKDTIQNCSHPPSSYCMRFTIFAEIHCGPLNVPSHGSKQGNNDTVDSVVLFSCDRGYRLQGSAERKCSTLGTWDGEAPNCVGQL